MYLRGITLVYSSIERNSSVCRTEPHGKWQEETSGGEEDRLKKTRQQYEVGRVWLVWRGVASRTKNCTHVRIFRHEQEDARVPGCKSGSRCMCACVRVCVKVRVCRIACRSVCVSVCMLAERGCTCISSRCKYNVHTHTRDHKMLCCACIRASTRVRVCSCTRGPGKCGARMLTRMHTDVTTHMHSFSAKDRECKCSRGINREEPSHSSRSRTGGRSGWSS